MLANLPLSSQKYQRIYEPLFSDDDRFANLAMLPWDAELFGFGVAECQLGDIHFLLDNRQKWLDGISDWTNRHRVALLSCDIEPTDRNAAWLLYSSNFLVVDTTLQVTLAQLDKVKLPKPARMFRAMQEEDLAEVERIASTAFRFGRYHTDPFFPDALAIRRYVLWVRNAFMKPGANERIYILGQPGEVDGFLHFAVHGDLGDFRLAAINPKVSIGGLGYELYLNALHMLRNLGARRATAKISAANTAASGLYSLFGFRFLKPRLTFHWHAPDWSACCNSSPVLEHVR